MLASSISRHYTAAVIFIQIKSCFEYESLVHALGAFWVVVVVDRKKHFLSHFFTSLYYFSSRENMHHLLLFENNNILFKYTTVQHFKLTNVLVNVEELSTEYYILHSVMIKMCM